MRSNPNTTVAGGGGAVGILVAWLLGHFHVALSAEDGAAISTVLASLLLLLGRNGIRGVLRMVWRGKAAGTTAAPGPPPPSGPAGTGPP